MIIGFSFGKPIILFIRKILFFVLIPTIRAACRYRQGYHRQHTARDR